MYYGKITEHYDRLTDETWKARFTGAAGTPAPDVPWMTDLIVSDA